MSGHGLPGTAGAEEGWQLGGGYTSWVKSCGWDAASEWGGAFSSEAFCWPGKGGAMGNKAWGEEGELICRGASSWALGAAEASVAECHGWWRTADGASLRMLHAGGAGEHS